MKKIIRCLLIALSVTFYAINSNVVYSQSCTYQLQDIYFSSMLTNPKICVNYASPLNLTCYPNWEYECDQYGGCNEYSYYENVYIKKPDGSTAFMIAHPMIISNSYTIPGGFFNVVGDWVISYDQVYYCTNLRNTVSFTLKVVGVTSNSIGYNEAICNIGGTPQNIVNVSINSNSTYTNQWQSKIESGSWNNISGANLISCQPSYINQTTLYRRIVTTNELGCISSPSNEVYKYVYPALNPGAVGNNQEVCYNISPSVIGETTAPTGGGSFPNYSYQWYSSTDNTNWNLVSGATGKTYQPSFILGYSYFKRKTIDASCGESYTNSVQIHRNNDLTAGTIGSDQLICYGAIPSIISVTGIETGGIGSNTYQWYSSPDNASWSVASGSSTGQNYHPPALTSKTYYRKAIINSCRTAYTGSVTIDVRSALSAGSIGSDQTICYNDTPAIIATLINPSGASNSFTYSWESSLDNTTFNPIPGADQVSYQPPALTQTTYYRKKVIDANCPSIYTGAIVKTVRPQFSVGSIGSNQIICNGITPALLTNASAPSGGQGTYTYIWESSLNNTDWSIITGATGVSYQPGALTATTYYRRKVTDAFCGNGYNTNVTITVKPVFSVGSIASSQTICINTTPALLSSTSPSGGMGGYTYFWENSLNGTDFNAISGATNETYQPGVLSQTTYYRRHVTDASCGAGYTNIIQIIVRPSVNLGTIGSDQSICYNSTPGFLTTLTAPSGGNSSFTYTWESSIDNINWNIISGATGASYQPGALTVKTYYRKSVTDLCGSGYTNTVTITIRPDISFGTIATNQTICYSTAPSLLVTDIGPSGGTGSFTWLWESSPNNSAWSPITGSTNESYQPVNLTSTMYYRRKVINTCGSDYTNTIVITVRPDLVPGMITSNQSICYNTTPALLVTSSLPAGGTGSFTYQWQSSLNNSAWNNISGATSETYQSGAMTTSLYFRRSETSGTCGTVQTNSVQVFVNNQLVAGSIKSDQTICYGTSPAIFLTNTYPSGGVGSYSYQWQKIVASSWTDITSATSETYTSSPLASTTYFRRSETSGTCGTVYSNQITVTARNQFLPGVIGSSQTVNYGAVPSELVSMQSASGGAETFTYQWQSSLDNLTWSNITGANSESFQPPALTVKKYYKRLTTDGSCGTIETNVLTINVNTSLVPGSIKDNQTICYNTSPSLLVTDVLPSGGNGTYSYQWQKTEDGITWTNITAANNNSYQPTALINTTYFRKKVTSVSFEDYSNIVTVTVNPAFIPGTIGSDQAVCKTYASAPITTIVSPTGQSIQNLWQISDNNGSWTDISGATNDYYDPGVLTASKYFRKKVTSSCGTGYTNSVKITVNDELQSGTIGSDQSIAYNTTPALLTGSLPSGGSGTFTYQWYYSLNNTDWQVVITGGNAKDYQPGSLSQTTYFERKTTGGSCGEKYSNTITVTVFDSLLPGVVSDAQNICYNTAPALFSGTSPSGGTGQYSYQWQYSLQGVTWTDIPSEVGISFKPDILKVNTYYRRSVTSGNSTVYSNFVMIKVYDQVSLPVTDLKTSYCKGATVSLNVVNPVCLSYKWFDSQHAYLMDGTKYTLSSIAVNNTVYVKSLNLNGCLSDYLEQKIIIDNVKASFTQDITTVTLGDAIKFTSTSVNASSYAWNFFEGDIINETNPVHYYNTLGVNSKKFSVKLIVTSPGGCLDSLLLDGIITVVNIVNGIESNMAVTFSYYPNPVTEKLCLSSNENIKTVKIFNISGKMIESLTFDSESVFIDFSELKSDIYILEINGLQDSKKNIKIIKK